jgi:hypothetical protein
MQDRYEFSQSFANGIKLLVMNRLKEMKEVTKLYSLHGLK